jgi:hypothetical protein
MTDRRKSNSAVKGAIAESMASPQRRKRHEDGQSGRPRRRPDDGRPCEVRLASETRQGRCDGADGGAATLSNVVAIPAL